MKRWTRLLFIAILFGCGQNEKSREEIIVKSDSVVSAPVADSVPGKNKDTSIMEVSHKVLICLQKKDFACLAEYAHPAYGIRFSPYAFVDTLKDKVFSKNKLAALSKDKNKINWGSYDAVEEEIIMDANAYLKKFVYDVDFLNATKKTINTSSARGNMINNLDSIYPSASFSEFYFPGFDPKFDGMDWRALRLVFKNENGKFFLIGIIHDQWTT